MQFNTLYQLYAMKLAGAPALELPRTLLLMPDLFNYWMTGVAACERTIASTSQFYNPCSGGWATDLLDSASACPPSILPAIAEPATRLGPCWRLLARSGTGTRRSMPPPVTTPHRRSPPCPPRAPTGATSVPARGR